MEALTGLPFISMLLSLTLACLLIMLDTSIVSTVRYIDEATLYFRGTDGIT